MESQANIALLQQLKTGNFHALEQIYARFQRPLLAKALYLLKDEAAAEDLVQTIFIEFWQKQLYLQIEESLEGYLFRAVHNRSLNEIKRLQRLTHRAEGYLQELDEAVDPKEPRSARIKKVSCPCWTNDTIREYFVYHSGNIDNICHNRV